MSTTPHTYEIDDNTSTMHTSAQHGMRYPDGTHKWVQDTEAGRLISFAKLANGDDYTTKSWDLVLTGRAEAAKVSLEKYRAQHTPVTRTVVVAVTEAVVTK